MLRIDEPSSAFVRYVASNMREQDLAEFLAGSFADTKEELVDALVERYGEDAAVICASDDRAPVAVGAMIMARPNVITLMFFATDRFPKIARPLTRFIRQRLFPKYHAAGVHRIECVSVDGYDKAHAWIKVLGLSEEAVMPGYGKNGETFRQFAWVKDASSAG